MDTSSYYYNQMSDINLELEKVKKRIEKCEKVLSALNGLKDLSGVEDSIKSAKDLLEVGFKSGDQIFSKADIGSCESDIASIEAKIHNVKKEIYKRIQTDNLAIESLNKQYETAQKNYHSRLAKEQGE